MKLTSFDVETRGVLQEYALQPFRVRTGQAWLTMCAMASKDDGAVSIVKPTREQLKAWLDTCKARGLTICGWNIAFDMAWLVAMGLREEVYANKWVDGMVLWRHLVSSPKFTGLEPIKMGLKAAVAQFLPAFANYADDIDFATDDPEEFLKLIQYNKSDAVFTLWLCVMFLKQLTPQQIRTIKIEAACLPMVAETYVEGICINVPASQALEKTLTDTANLAMVKLKLNSSEDIDPSVLASPTKLRKLLYEDWGLRAPKYTEKGAASTDRDALSLLADADPRASLLNEYREATNNRTKFATGAIVSAEYNGDGRSRPSARVFGAYTGRVTYSSKIGRGKAERPTGVPIHQWKRATDFRDQIDAPEGYELLEFDFAGQEFRWMAVMSRDPTMLKLCEPGEDAHAFMGSRIRGFDYRMMCDHLHGEEWASTDSRALAKQFRQLGKVANLSLQYRTSAMTLRRVSRVSHGVQISDTEARAIHATYLSTYPGVKKYWKHQIRIAREMGYIETVSGRRIQVGREYEWTDETVWGRESAAINSPIQGSGAEQKYLALAVLKDYLPRVDGRFYMELHDGIFIVVPQQHSDKAVVEIKELLSNLPYKKAWGVDLPVQFPVDAKRGLSWGQLKEVL